MATPLAVCEERDVKGLYAASKAGRLPGLTGTCASAPYEVPACPEVRLEGKGDVRQAAVFVISHLESIGTIPVRPSNGKGRDDLLLNNAVPSARLPRPL